MKYSIVLTLALMSVTSFAAEVGIWMNPILSITEDGNDVTILGNMPLPDSVPADKKQQNQVTYSSRIDDLGCKNLAKQAMDRNTGLVVIGNVGRRFADNGKFTLKFTSISECYLY